MRAFRLARIIGVLLFAAFLMVVYVWQRVWTYEKVQTISEKEEQIEELMTEIARLKEQRSRLADFDRIRTIAQGKCSLNIDKKHIVPVLTDLSDLVEEDRQESEKQFH